MVEKEHLIDLVGISKEFDGVQVLKNINLYIRKKEFITLLGPSGCGKTTTLRIIGGFETPSEGQVLFGGQDISALPPYKRRVNTVFQKYALFPHLNVYDNIAFGLKLKKLPKKQIAEKVGQMLELVNPELVETSGEQCGAEGCLSVPGKYGLVKRPNYAKVRAQNRNGEWFETEGEALIARCFCHELDHLDGIVYTEVMERFLTEEELEQEE